MKSSAKSKTRTVRLCDRKQSRTCYDYFKIKKATNSLESGLKENIHKQNIKETLSSEESEFSIVRPKRLRHDSIRQNDVKTQASSVLSIQDVQTIVAAQDSFEGGVNCSVCGKLYKSRVCFIKHIWEHTVYWNVFKGAKNHERVLSIQAAIILFCGVASHQRTDLGPDLCSLLVTSPHSVEQKHVRENMAAQLDGFVNHISSNSAKASFEREDIKTESMKQSDESSIIDVLLSMSGQNCEDYTLNDQFRKPSSNAECQHQNWSHVPILPKFEWSSLVLQNYASPSAELPPLFMLMRSLPTQQLSSSVSKEYKNQIASDGYVTAKSTSASFVSPLKRKRED